MKIKRKVEMNLPQLIEWGFENDIKNKSYLTHDREGNTSEVRFDIEGLPLFSSMVSKTDIFTFEVEKEITEDTVIPRIVEIDLCGYDQHEDVFMQENKSINQILNEDEVKKRAFYILNDDLTMTLIWRDGKLIEE